MELSAAAQDLLPGSPDQLRWPWLALLAGGLLCGLVVWWLRRDGADQRELLVSHTSRLRRLPRYRTLVRRRRWLVATQALAVGAAVSGAVLLVARPSEVGAEADRPNLDLIVCLDVSRSMLPTAASVSEVVQQVVDSLPGDRVGLTIFDGRSVVKLPLTDAHASVRSALHQAEVAFDERDWKYYGATVGWRSSQLGDGLHSCVHGFDRLDERRGRVVLVASDNRPFGRPVHELVEVADQARRRGVVVHALGIPQMERRPEAVVELREAAEATGGTLVVLGQDGVAAQVVERIDRLERRRLQESPREVLDDRPTAGVLLTLCGVSVLGALWLRREP